jgi:hypothetical protein
MTTITFTDEHLRTIQTALEVYSRLRSGQIKIAMDEAFADYNLTWEETDQIEQFVRSFLFPAPPTLIYDNHGGYYDQYDNNYNEQGELEGELSYQDKCRIKRPHIPKGAYYGVASKEIGDGTIAYEIYSTLRQYIALKRTDGYHDMWVDFRDPLELSGIPLPKIEGFSKEKRFPIKGKAIVNKLKKAENTKDYSKVWEIVGDYMKRHYPELKGYSKGHLETEGVGYVLVTEGAIKNNN